jgi:hypothetical protein
MLQSKKGISADTGPKTSVVKLTVSGVPDESVKVFTNRNRKPLSASVIATGEVVDR